MRWRRVPGGVASVLERGDEVLESLRRVAAEAGVQSGFISGLGAVDRVQLAFYDLERKTYDRIDLEGDHEIGSLTGNLTRLDGAPFVHVHAVVAGRDFTARTGHLMRAHCSATVELFVHDFGAEPIDRKPDAAVGLNLWKL
jgi:predicted DNA-binding protein with PD1-like motif